MDLVTLQTHLATRLAAHPAVTQATTLADHGYHHCPYGVALTLPHGQTLLFQSLHRAATSPPPPATRPAGPPSAPALPPTGRVPTALVEELLAAAHAGLPLTRLDRYSARPTPPRVRYGVAATLVDNSVFYTYVRHTLRPSERPTPSTLFRPLAEL